METQTTNGILEEFRLEFLAFWRRLPNKMPFLLLLAAWVALFDFHGSSTLGYVRTPSLFGYLYYCYAEGSLGLLRSEEGYGILMPAVVMVLLWCKRRELMQLELRCWWPGLLLLVLGILIHLLGYTIQQSRISAVGFFVGLYGLTGLVWGYPWLKKTFFPFVLFGFCVPIGTLGEPVTFRLRLLVSQLVGLISHYLLAIDMSVQGNLLIDPTGHYQYEIAAACSGIRSLIATIVLSVIFGFVSFKESWKRLVMIASAFPLAVLGNVLRLLTIVIAAEMGGQSAGEYVHDSGLFSLLPYVPAFIGLMMLERYLHGSQKSDAATPLKPAELTQT
ncbi:MAG TPA: exosortase/archaeosortase family protein [Verrucomicrobiae bacterium]|nr:exosortase/archaeosortase family protein [Verrucomicrobiae bacterium]